MTLTEAWADGMRSLHGMHVHGFPNLFVIGFAQAANLISNVPHNLIEAGETMAAVVRHAIDIDAEEVEVTDQAEADWIALLQGGERRIGNDPNCTPGYYNNEGQLRVRRRSRAASAIPPARPRTSPTSTSGAAAASTPGWSSGPAPATEAVCREGSRGR